MNRIAVNPHYSREMRDQSQAVAIAHNYANGLFGEVFCNEISGPGVWWPGPISGGPMNYSGYLTVPTGQRMGAANA